MSRGQRARRRMKAAPTHREAERLVLVCALCSRVAVLALCAAFDAAVRSFSACLPACLPAWPGLAWLAVHACACVCARAKARAAERRAMTLILVRGLAGGGL